MVGYWTPLDAPGRPWTPLDVYNVLFVGDDDDVGDCDNDDADNDIDNSSDDNSNDSD